MGGEYVARAGESGSVGAEREDKGPEVTGRSEKVGARAPPSPMWTPSVFFLGDPGHLELNHEAIRGVSRLAETAKGDMVRFVSCWVSAHRPTRRDLISGVPRKSGRATCLSTRGILRALLKRA